MQQIQQHAQDIAIHGKGLVAAGTTAAAGALSWLDVANQVVDLASGIIAVVAGCMTVAWYAYRFYKIHRGGDNDQTGSSE